MTQEEKARAYDKAIKKIKYVIDHGVMVTNDGLKDIFPELAESEDERIRKEFCEDIWTYIPNEKAHKYITWLGKQGKENNTYVINNTPNCGISVYNEELPESEDEKIRKALTNWFKECHWDAIDDGKLKKEDILAWLEKQKPVKWSEEDEKIRKSIIKHYDGYKCASFDGILVTDILAWLEKQKPDEWNSDDEQYLLICKNALAKYQISDKWDANIISRWLDSRLKFIRPQLKQEWNEDDEHRRTDAIYFLETAKKHYAGTSEIDATISWLKSLKERIEG